MELCINCNRFPIQNKKHKLCGFCMQKKRNPDINLFEKKKTQFAAIRQKQIIKQQSSIKKKKESQITSKINKIKQISTKEVSFKQELIRVYAEIDSEREPICESCNRGGRPLSHSHTISQKKRKDLAVDKNNIILECFGSSDSCHEKWESGNLDKMRSLITFQSKMEYIKTHDLQIYNKIINKA